MAHVEVRNPATGELIERLPIEDEAAIERRLVQAQAAQPAWAALGFAERAACIARFRDWVAAEAERLARVLSRETGKPIRQARAELAGLAPRFAFFLERTEALLAEAIVEQSSDGDMVLRRSRDPLGVVANISAWNYPWFVGMNVIVPALLVGNALLYKPSEYATLSGLEMARGLRAAGVPEAVFQAVIGGGEVGAALIRPPVRGVFFTGSYRTGVEVAKAAAPHLMRVQLELGGKDPLYVADDVEIAWAAALAAEGAMYNAGQSCCAVERLYVHEAIYAPFCEALIERVRALRVGDPFDEATDVGPLTRPQQRAVLEAQIADALRQGARLGCGGKGRPGPGSFFEPTVVLDCHHGMAIMREESFGPVIGVQPVADDEQAIARMADTRYGLTAAVVSAERERAERILGRLRVGTAYWNCCDRVCAKLPWSGRGQSGIGATLGEEGILAFCEPRGWHLRRPPRGAAS